MTFDPDRLPCAIVELDENRTVVAANAAAAQLTGHSVESLVGRPVTDLLAAGNPKSKAANGWHPSVRLRSVQGMPDHEVTLVRADGTPVDVVVSGRYERDSQGVLTGAVIVLREARDRLRKPSGIEVVSTVSHELRSPLTSVKGYTSLLLNRWDRLKEDQKRMMLEQVHHDADRVTRLVNELLDISRLETGRLVLRRQMVDVPAIAHGVVEKVGMEYDALECEIHFPGEFPQVYADADKVEQVLTNLVENAAKYASPQGMRVEGSVHGNEIAVTVHDRGEGIPPSDLPRVFTKFFRRDHGRPTGSGLGLWISRGLVQAHGGRLTAVSTVGEGSSFRFTLPAGTFEQLHGAQEQES